jgi:hypothetical protein
MMFRSLRSKLLSCFALVVLAVAVVGAIGSRAVHNTNETLQYSANNLGPTLDQVGRIRYYFARMQWYTTAAASALLTTDKAALAHAKQASDEAWRNLDEGVRDYESLPLAPEEKAP